MNKIIHITTDEKFINSAYWQFNTAFPNKNKFYLFLKDPQENLVHVDFNDDFVLIKDDFPTLKSLAKSFKEANLVILHGLDYQKSYFAQHLPNANTVVWIIWGYEFYNNPEIFNQSSLLGPLTRTYYQNIELKKAGLHEKTSFKQKGKLFYQNLYYQFKFGTPAPNKSIKRTIERADYCAILYPEEFDFIKRKLNLSAEYIKFSYYPIELMVKDESARIKGENILLGNSSSLTNNHFEAFQLLKRLPTGKRKIITPLSYGDKIYGEKVIEEGNNLFSGQFHPLIDFMPLHQYNKYLEDCGIVIMNHYRQQAVGNILTMLWMGAKVYLNEKNTLFHYLKNIGIVVCSIEEDLNPENKEVFKLLSFEQQNFNRKIIKTEIGQEVLLRELKKQITSLLI